MQKRSLKEIQESRNEKMKEFEGRDIISEATKEFEDMAYTIGTAEVLTSDNPHEVIVWSMKVTK